MSVSLYRLSIPLFIRGLRVVQGHLDQAEQQSKKNGREIDELINARLAPDMLSLAGQIQRVTDTSKNAIERLTGLVPPRFDDTESTLNELRDRVESTITFFESVGLESLAASEAKEINLNFSKIKATFQGADYLLTFVLPNFYFHIATLHNILRNQGIDIGKAEYLGSLEQFSP